MQRSRIAIIHPVTIGATGSAPTLARGASARGASAPNPAQSQPQSSQTVTPVNMTTNQGIPTNQASSSSSSSYAFGSNTPHAFAPTLLLAPTPHPTPTPTSLPTLPRPSKSSPQPHHPQQPSLTIKFPPPNPSGIPLLKTYDYVLSSRIMTMANGARIGQCFIKDDDDDNNTTNNTTTTTNNSNKTFKKFACPCIFPTRFGPFLHWDECAFYMEQERRALGIAAATTTPVQATETETVSTVEVETPIRLVNMIYRGSIDPAFLRV